MIRRFTFALLIASSSFLWPPATAHADRHESRLEVVTTLGVLKTITEEIGGDRVHAQSLCDPRQDPHFVQPRPTLMKKARNADLFIEIGLQLEMWAQKVVDGSGNPRIQTGQPGRVVASTGISTLELPSTLSREWGDVHPYGNPHVWLDPINAKIIAENIARALERADPTHKDHYEKLLRDFQRRIDLSLFGQPLIDRVGGKRLTRLARQGRLMDYLRRKNLVDKLEGWLRKAAPLRGQKIITFHKTWIYFASRFGLEIPLELEAKPGIPPSAKHVDRVLQTITRDHVPLIVVASFYDRVAADHVAQKTNARVVQLPIDTGGIDGVNSYLDLIDHLIEAMTSALEKHK